MTKYILVSDHFHKMFLSVVCKRVYRSGGKNRRKRLKWVVK